MRGRPIDAIFAAFHAAKGPESRNERMISSQPTIWFQLGTVRDATASN